MALDLGVFLKSVGRMKRHEQVYKATGKIFARLGDKTELITDFFMDPEAWPMYNLYDEKIRYLLLVVFDRTGFRHHHIRGFFSWLRRRFGMRFDTRKNLGIHTCGYDGCYHYRLAVSVAC